MTVHALQAKEMGRMAEVSKLKAQYPHLRTEWLSKQVLLIEMTLKRGAWLLKRNDLEGYSETWCAVRGLVAEIK